MGQISGDEGLSVMAADTHQLAERCTELVTVDPARPGGVQRLSQPVPSTCMTASEKSSKVDQEHTDKASPLTQKQRGLSTNRREGCREGGGGERE